MILFDSFIISTPVRPNDSKEMAQTKSMGNERKGIFLFSIWLSILRQINALYSILCQILLSNCSFAK